jgi:hypothetical protein
MELEAVGVTQAGRSPAPFQIQLKFGKQAYAVVEVRRGEEAYATSPTRWRGSRNSGRRARCGVRGVYL